jgi:Do/DeqQ family serine protease
VDARTPRDSYADLVARVEPAVVTVRTERVVRTGAVPAPFAGDPMLRRFFGEEWPPPVEGHGAALGSGVIVNPDGTILTNHHVVEDARRITVELSDHRTLEAKRVGSDPPSDLAVLKVDASGLPSLPLGDSDRVRVGDVALAFGNPLGVGQTVTMGIISAKGRSTSLGDGSYEDFLQTDAPINQGNSGGALVNTRGELVGINSQILSQSGGNIGIGFAIPANMARNVMEQLVHGGSVRRGRLGIVVQPLTTDLAEGLGLSEVRGALVASVEPGGPAARAGLRRGDVILAFEGEAIVDANDLRNKVAGTRPGSDAKLSVKRDGREITVTSRLGEMNPDRDLADAAEASGSGESRYGMSVEPLTPQTARSLGIRGEHGVLVTGVDPRGTAASAGIRQGDVIEEVNHRSVADVDGLRSALSRSGDRPALMLVNREGSTLYIALSPAA